MRGDLAASNQTPDGITPSSIPGMSLASSCHPTAMGSSDPSTGATMKVMSLHQTAGTTEAPGRVVSAPLRHCNKLWEKKDAEITFAPPQCSDYLHTLQPSSSSIMDNGINLCRANSLYHSCQTFTHAVRDSPNPPNFTRSRLRIDGSPHSPLCILIPATLQNLMELPASPKRALQDLFIILSLQLA